MTIRRTPEDFRVSEQLAADFTLDAPPSPSAFAVFRLTKTSLTTPEAVARLGHALGLRPGSIAYAGLKDKHAVTTQHVTATGVRDAAPCAGPGWSAEPAGWSGRAIDASAIAANRFDIFIRDLSREAAKEISTRARAAADPADAASVLFVNYFGDQRFGSARHGEGFAAAKLALSDFDGALRLLLASPARKDTGAWRTFTRTAATKWGDWHALAAELPQRPERKAIEALAAGRTARDAFASLPYFLQEMCVDAFQSWLWNGLACARAAALAGESAWTIDTPHGPNICGPGALLARAGTQRVPLPHAEVRLDAKDGEALESLLSSLGLSSARLAIPGLRRPAFGKGERPLIARASHFALGPTEADDLSAGGKRRAVRVSFDLPSGAYATVVLRMLGE
jgi:tRNA pseudouridine13 synthase